MFSLQIPRNGAERSPRLTFFAIEARQVRLLQVLASTELMSARYLSYWGMMVDSKRQLLREVHGVVASATCRFRRLLSDRESTAGRQRSN